MERCVVFGTMVKGNMEEEVRGRITVEEGEKRSAAFSSPPPSNSHLSPAKSSRGHTHSLSLSGEKTG